MISCDRVCPPVRVNCLQEFMDNTEQADLCIVMRYYNFFGDMASYEGFWLEWNFVIAMRVRNRWKTASLVSRRCVALRLKIFLFFFWFLLIVYILCTVVSMYNRNLYNRINSFLNFIPLSCIKKIIQKSLETRAIFYFSNWDKEHSDFLYSINKSVCIKQPARYNPKIIQKNI